MEEPKDKGAARKIFTSIEELCRDAPSHNLDIRILGGLPVTLDELAAVSGRSLDQAENYVKQPLS